MMRLNLTFSFTWFATGICVGKASKRDLSLLFTVEKYRKGHGP